MTCKSRIVQEMKYGKASSLWPVHDKENKLPVCGGKITLDLEIEGGGPCHCGDYCYCESAHTRVNVQCSRCRNPFINERLQRGYDVQSFLTELVTISLEGLEK